MDPLRLLEALCRRHGLPLEAGRHLVGLVARALDGDAAQRRLLIEEADRSLARLAIEGSQPQVGTRDGKLLDLVARALHGWKLGDAPESAR